MGVTPFQTDWCLRLLDRLTEFEVTRILSADLADSLGSVQRVKTPMDFQIVRNKLNRGEYESVADWGRDVRLIWFNVKSCYQPKAPVYLIAEHLEQWFDRHFQRFPRREMYDWLMRFQRAQNAAKTPAGQRSAPSREYRLFSAWRVHFIGEGALQRTEIEWHRSRVRLFDRLLYDFVGEAVLGSFH
jgi:hypothetical protein